MRQIAGILRNTGLNVNNRANGRGTHPSIILPLEEKNSGKKAEGSVNNLNFNGS
jgi:hypothetical protein